MGFLAAALSFSIIPIAEPPRSLAGPCEAFDSSPGLRGERGMTAEDLVQLADIGRADPNETQSAFGLSPDMKQIAFAVRRGNAETNTYCQRLMIMPLDRSRAPRELGRARQLGEALVVPVGAQQAGGGDDDVRLHHLEHSE